MFINFKLFFKNDGKGICELNKYDYFMIKENVNFYEKDGVIFVILLKVKGYYLYCCKKQ